MKTTNWFKIGELIPDNATFITKEWREDGGWDDDPMGGYATKSEYVLYEYPVGPDELSKGDNRA